MATLPTNTSTLPAPQTGLATTPIGVASTLAPIKTTPTPAAAFPGIGAGVTTIAPSATIGESTRSMKTTTPQFVVNSKAATADIENAKNTVTETQTGIGNQKNLIAAAAETKKQEDLIKEEKDTKQKEIDLKTLAMGDGTTGTTTPPYKLNDSGMKSTLPYSDGSADVTFNDGTTQHLTKEDLVLQNQGDTFNMQRKFTDTVDKIYSGAIPLRPEQEAMIQDLKNNYQGMIQRQQDLNTTTTNLAYLKGYRTGAAEDAGFQTSYINAVTSEGMKKVGNLQTEMISKVAELTKALKDENVEEIKKTYDVLRDTEDKLDTEFRKTVSDVKDAINAQIKKQEEDLHSAITNIITNPDYSYEQKEQAFSQVKNKDVLTASQMMTINTELAKQKKDAETAKRKALDDYMPSFLSDLKTKYMAGQVSLAEAQSLFTKYYPKEMSAFKGEFEDLSSPFSTFTPIQPGASNTSTNTTNNSNTESTGSYAGTFY